MWLSDSFSKILISFFTTFIVSLVNLRSSIFTLGKKAVLLCFLGYMAACQSPAEKQQESNLYYDVKGYVQTQIDLLNKQKPVVNKLMVVSGEQEKRSTAEINWQKELELFVQADINKPAYRNSYAINRPDSVTYEYRVQTGEDLPVRTLKIVLNEPGGSPVLIEARLLSENKLYESEKNLVLRSGQQGGTWRVQSYRVRGFQELAISSRKPFDVQATIQPR